MSTFEKVIFKELWSVSTFEKKNVRKILFESTFLDRYKIGFGNLRTMAKSAVPNPAHYGKK